MWKILQHNTRSKSDPGESVAVFLDYPQTGGRAESQGPLLEAKDPACGVASGLCEWKSLKSKSKKISVEAKLWEYTVPVLPRAEEYFSHPDLQTESQ